MNSVFRHRSIVAVWFAACLVFLGCGDDNGTVDGWTPDTSPPVVASVLPVDAQHVQLTFNEAVYKPSAERIDNYSIAEVIPIETSAGRRDDGGSAESGSVVPAQIELAVAALIQNDVVLLTTRQSMSEIAYDLTVRRVSDVNGNVMTGETTSGFTGMNAPDETDPFVATRSPGIGATGVGVSQSVIVTFSEPMVDQSVFAAFSWTSAAGRVPVKMQKPRDNIYTFSPLVPVAGTMEFTVSLANTAQDRAGNPLVPTSWKFRTTGASDTTPPSLLSSVPSDGAADVSMGTVLELRFSEPIDPTSIGNMLITPVPGEGTEEWLDGGRTVRFTPDESLLVDTQYLILMPAGFFADLAGNANSQSYAVQFNTGPSFASGAIGGILTGDPYSLRADDPTGALVVATTVELFGPGGDPDVLGVGFVDTDDRYSIPRLPDGRYYPFAILDSNDDGEINPDHGDAIGAFGADPRSGDLDQSPVYIDLGVTLPADVDFPLFDAEAISGTVVYGGEIYAAELPLYGYLVGLFDGSGFDPDNPPPPVISIYGGSLGWDPDYAINTIDHGLMPGLYYVGAFLDVNSNGIYDPSVDPSGYYRNPDTGELYPVNVEDGTDASDVVVYLEDPPAGAAPRPSVVWRTPRKAVEGRVSMKTVTLRIQDILRQMDSASPR